MTASHARRAKPNRYAFSTRGVRFDDEDAVRGQLYTPDRPADAPVVVLAPGAGLSWRPTLAATAERLAERGYAVLAFDHHEFGTTGDRQLLSPAGQRADLDDAIETARAAPEVDGDRLAVWGMDLSAGTALAAATETNSVTAVLARFPVSTGTTLLPGWVRPRLRGLAAGALDYPLSALGRLRNTPVDRRGKRVPLFGDAGEVAAIAAEDAARDTTEALGRDAGTTPARSLVKLQRHDLSDQIEEVHCPTLFVAGQRDTVAPPESVATLSESVADATLVRVPFGHYEPLSGRECERTVNHELAFLDAEL